MPLLAPDHLERAAEIRYRNFVVGAAAHLNPSAVDGEHLEELQLNLDPTGRLSQMIDQPQRLCIGSLRRLIIMTSSIQGEPSYQGALRIYPRLLPIFHEVASAVYEDPDHQLEDIFGVCPQLETTRPEPLEDELTFTRLCLRTEHVNWSQLLQLEASLDTSTPQLSVQASM